MHKFPIILQSPENNGLQFFRRINEDMTLEEKILGGEWKPAENPKVQRFEKYLETMTKKLHWKIV